MLLTLCECSPERLPCLVEYLKATQLPSRPSPRFTSYLYKVYETIPPQVTSWYTIWAKVIVIVDTSRRVVTLPVEQFTHLEIPVSDFQEADVLQIHRARCPRTKAFRNGDPRNDWIWVHAG